MDLTDRSPHQPPHLYVLTVVHLLEGLVLLVHLQLGLLKTALDPGVDQRARLIVFQHQPAVVNHGASLHELRPCVLDRSEEPEVVLPLHPVRVGGVSVCLLVVGGSVVGLVVAG